MGPLALRLQVWLAQRARRRGWHRLAAGVGARAARQVRDWKMHAMVGKSLLAQARAREAARAFSFALTYKPGHAKTERLAVEAALRTGPVADLIDNEIPAAVNDPWPLRRLCAALYRHDALDAEAQAKMRARTTMRFCRMISVCAWARANDLPIMAAGEAEVITQVRPPLLGADGFVPAPVLADRVESNAPYVVDLPNARIFSKSDTIVTQDEAVLNDLPAHPVFGGLADLRDDRLVLAQKGDCFLIATTGREFPEHPGGIFLGGAASGEFGHWVQELLMKLRFFAQHSDFARLPIIVDQDMPQSHFDYLKCLVPNELVLLPRDSGLLCRRLLVAPTPTFHPLHVFGNDVSRNEVGALSSEGLRYLRAGVLANRSADPPARTRKLYLSRRNMRWRRVTNDGEIAAFLAARGFEVVNIEQLSFVDQVELFRAAEFIVAPEGSALLNVIFCDPAVKLVILAQRDFWHGYHGPLRALGYRQLWVIGDIAYEAKQADYAVPLERIARALEMQGQGTGVGA